MDNPQIPAGNYLELLMDAVCIVDSEGYYVYVSAAFERIFGYKPEEMIGRKMIELVAPEDREKTLNTVQDIMGGQPQLNFENTYLHKKGHRVHILWSARWSPENKVRVAVARDVTQRKQAERLQAATYDISEAAYHAEDLETLFATIHRIIGSLMPADSFAVALCSQKTEQLQFCFHADETTFTSAEPSAMALARYVMKTGRAILLAEDFRQNLVEELRPLADVAAHCWLSAPLISPDGPLGVLMLTSYTDSRCYCEDHLNLLEFVSTQVATAIQRLRLRERLKRLAQYDELTELPNRALLFDRLDQSLARARRHQRGVALLFLDLDHFKRVNDSFGHGTGDELLIAVADRLRECVRSSDTVARIGGDEFVILLDEIDRAEDAESVAAKIQASLSRPVELNRAKVTVRPSIGMALYPRDGDTARQILRHADEAMYTIKRGHHTPFS